MARTRDSYQLTGTTVDQLRQELNFALQRIADRLDKMEGIRGEAAIESGVTVAGDVVVTDDDDVTIHSME